MPGLRYSTPQGDKTFPLGEKVTIGRDAKNELPLPHDRLVSHQHARIHHEGDTYVIEDLHSTNGTFLLREGDDKFTRITSPQRLLPNDVIRVGLTHFVFDVGVAPDIPPVTPSASQPSENRATTTAAAPGPPLITCPDCGSTVPEGEYCGACGTDLVTATGAGPRRHHAFAANPAEHVLLPSVISTLFPHLPHRRTVPFRIALLVAGVLLFVLALFRLTGPAVVAATVAVPLLYLIYLYEVEVYENEPYLVIGLTVVLGLLLGIPWALFTGPLVIQAMEQNSMLQGIDLGASLVPGVILPLVAQLLMLAGPLIIYVTRRYDEALDGFAFGVACALGFTLSMTLVNLLPDLQRGLVSDMPVVTNVLDVLLRGLLNPFLNASTTGLIAGALWLRRGRTRAPAAHGWSTSLVVAILIAAVVRIVLGLVAISAGNAIVYEVTAYVAVAIVLLFLVRVSLHHMLLAEAVEVQIGESLPCVNCHRIVPRMAFCPHCGVATRATPKTGVGQTGRAVR